MTMQNNNPQKLIFIDGKNRSQDIEKIDICRHIVKIKFFNSDKIYSYSRHKIKLKTNYYEESSVQNIMKYFAAEAQNSPIKIDNQDVYLLEKYLNQITKITDDMILSHYITGKILAPHTFDTKKLIYPFGLNISQKQAVENAFSSRISIIQGPPGTGKTQTILNIIANVILQNKSIAVVSNNNSAVSNIEEKLKKHNLDFLAAKLGSRQNKADFIANPKGYPNLSDLATKQKGTDLISQISSHLASIAKILKSQNKLAQCQQEKEDTKLEHTYFKQEHSDIKTDKKLERCLSSLTSDKIFKLWSYCLSQNTNRCHLKNYLYFFKHLGWRYLFFKSKNIFTQILCLQQIFYSQKLSELNAEISKLEKYLSKNKLNDKINLITNLSFTLLKSNIYKRIKNKGQALRPIYSGSLVSEEFLAEYPIILSTLFSLKNICQKDFIFDYLVVDEASQADLLTSVIAMSCAKNIIVVGDIKQLPNIITREAREISLKLLQQYPVNKAYHFHENSLLSSILALYPEAPNVLLREHYRCAPKIIGFCNHKFYDDKLIILPQESHDKDTLKAIQTPPGNHARMHINQRQIDIIKEEIAPYLNKNLSIGIITPYRNQVNKLQEDFKNNTNIEIDTIHKFQGREKDIIIFSTVDNKISKFIDDKNLVNVAVSRAIKKFWIVYSNEGNKTSSNLIDLVNYIKHNNFQVVRSKIYSIFDLLYKPYTEERIKVLSKIQKISPYPSENFAFECIKSCLKKINNTALDVIYGLPLKHLVHIDASISDEEAQFIRRDSHVDFFIYNKFNKQLILAIEVNGPQHEEDTLQTHRDTIKKAILDKIGLSLLIIKTKGSKEKEAIMNRLSELGYSPKQ